MSMGSRSATLKVGAYTLVRRMAAGGMADIFLGHREGPRGYERSVVVKMLRVDWAEEANLAHDLLSEARIATALDHPNIVRVLDVGESHERPFIVMEFLFGRSLQQVVDRAYEVGLPPGPSQIEVIMADCLAALACAHRGSSATGGAPIIHRDVSPSNLFVGFDGVVRLLDFGLAKSLSQIGRTRAGVVKGKYGYMSPEQARRESLDPRSDIFSAGVVLWELLMGRRLFEGSHELETIQRVINKRAPFPKFEDPGLPLRHSWVAYRALSRGRRLRFATADAMRRSLLGGREISEPDRDGVQHWMEELFHVELYARDLALQRARSDPQFFRKVRDSGFELLPEVTDPAMPRLKRGITTTHPPRPSAPHPSRRNMLGVALASLLAVSLGLGVFVGRLQPDVPIAYLYVVAPRGTPIRIGSHAVGAAPLNRIPVEAGRHLVTAETPAGPVTRWIEVRVGQNRLVDFTRTPTKTAP